MAFRDRLLLLVQDLLRTPGAREVRVLWDSSRQEGRPPHWQTFTPQTPPAGAHQFPVGEGADEVTVYLEGHLVGAIPWTSMIRHINGKRLRVGCEPLPVATDVVTSATNWYVLRTALGLRR